MVIFSAESETTPATQGSSGTTPEGFTTPSSKEKWFYYVYVTGEN